MKTKTLAIVVLFLASCGAEIKVKKPATETTTGTRSGTTVTQKFDAGVSTPATKSTPNSVSESTGAVITAAQVLRHLPGTAVKLAGGGTVYLVASDGTLSSFSNTTALHTSGYSDAMVATITAAEFSCYRTGKTIKSGLPAPGEGHLRDGTLVKENNKSTVYIVSDGIAWSIVSMDVFTAAGYKTESVEIVNAGTIRNLVDEVGSCADGLACLDAEYLSSCAKEEIGDISLPPITVEDTGVKTSATTSVGTSVATQTRTTIATSVQTATTMATAAPTSVATSVATTMPTSVATSIATSVPIQTQTVVMVQTATQNTVQVTSAATALATSTQTASVVSVTSVATSAQTQTTTQTTTITAVATGTPATWVWMGDGTKLCLNAVYFMPRSATRAVLRTWTGPYVTGTNAGPVTGKDAQNRFCWDFVGMPAGIYRLWADVPATTCANTDFCGDDGMGGDGAQYGTAPNATATERKWLYCLDTGCDGYAVFNGTAWIPANS